MARIEKRGRPATPYSSRIDSKTSHEGESMIQKMSHATVYVLDQDVAKDFYVNKLGFEVKVDQSLPTDFAG